MQLIEHSYNLKGFFFEITLFIKNFKIVSEFSTCRPIESVQSIFHENLIKNMDQIIAKYENDLSHNRVVMNIKNAND